MKFSTYISKVVFGTVLVLTTFSCKETLDIDPKQSIDAGTALTSKETVQAAIISAYSTLKSTALYGNRLITLPEALADNGRSTGKSARLVGEAANQIGAHFSNWGTAYNAIAKINYVIQAIPLLNVSGITQAQKDQWLGELLFLRALYHFDIARTYAYIPGAVVASKDFGTVPLVIKAINTTDEALAFKPSRASYTEFYAAMYADLDAAIPKLGNITTSALANKQAAQALYSRIALYNKDWAKVIAVSSDAITFAGSRLLTPTNYVAGWSAVANPESLFEVAFATVGENIGVNESLQTAFTTLSVRGTRNNSGGWGDLVPTSTLLTDLGITATNNGLATAALTARTADVRNLLFELGNTHRGNPYIECTKFIGKNGTINLDNVPVLRVAELYLNRAEAYAATGKPVEALADVNKIRTGRGLTASGATGAALDTEIELQRRVEFAFEGFRFFDMKRKGKDIVKPVTSTTLFFTDNVILPAIPTGDIDGNPNLKQNSGY